MYRFLHNVIINGFSKLAIHLLWLSCFPVCFVDNHSLLDTTNRLWQTALHIAVATSQYDVLRALVLAGASPEERDLCGNTPLHKACQKGDITAAFLLLCLPSTEEIKSIKAKYGIDISRTGNGIPQNLELRNCDGMTSSKNFSFCPQFCLCSFRSSVFFWIKFS